MVINLDAEKERKRKRKIDTTTVKCAQYMANIHHSIHQH